jgi:uncharacterized protein YndB with AHSA1/START domain
MNNRNYTSSFTVSQPPEQVFAAINDVRAWWSAEIKGHADKVGDVFVHRVEDIHRCELQVQEMVPGKKVAWHVIDNHFNFTKDKSEWIDTDIVFDIARRGDKTEVTVTHVGLVPEYECYDICVDGWGTYFGRSLKALVATGKGDPYMGKAMTASEEILLANRR